MHKMQDDYAQAQSSEVRGKELYSMMLHSLSERISYIPATTQPLSADIGIVHGDSFNWIFDVGSTAAIANAIQEFGKEKKIVLSHFHEDHIGNIEHIDYCDMYCGDYTYLKLHKGTEIRSPISCEDGVRLTIFPIPSAHAKGMLGLEVDEEYAFLGDAVYGAQKKGRTAYNMNMLQETIKTLESVKARRFLVSHDAAFVRDKEQVISELKGLYSQRIPGEAFLFL